MISAVGGQGSFVIPPSSNTGVLITDHIESSVHWLTGTTVQHVDSVLSWLARTLSESVEVLSKTVNGYSLAWRVGPVTVATNPARVDMRTYINIDGSGCEELGLARLAAILAGLEVRASRLDLAFDNCPFTPADLRDFWQAGFVRTRVRVASEAREGREFRNSKWYSDPKGDTFYMGSNRSQQQARCYDLRGPTRFELQLMGETAALAATQVLGLVSNGAPELVGSAALGFVRRFVDFVDPLSDSNVSRQKILPFWALFVQDAMHAVVTLTGKVQRTIEDYEEYTERQMAAVLATLVLAKGWEGLRLIVRKGVPRLKGWHKEALRLHRHAAGLGV